MNAYGLTLKSLFIVHARPQMWVRCQLMNQAV